MMRQTPKTPRAKLETALHDLPGWELRMGGNVLRGQWRFRSQATATSFAWAVLMRCFQLDFYPNVRLWNQWVTVETSGLSQAGALELAEALARMISAITGPPRLAPIETPSTALTTLEPRLRRFETSRLLWRLVEEDPEENLEQDTQA